VVLPDTKAVRERNYPWHREGVRTTQPGRAVVWDDLPPTKVEVRVFRGGASATPAVDTVFLREGDNEPRVIRLEPAPSLVGRVLDAEGNPAAGARVRLEAPDRSGALLTFVRDMPDYLERQVLPPFPVSLQEQVTGADGRFLFTRWEGSQGARYLLAESADGTHSAARIVDASAETAELTLAPTADGSATLQLWFPNRWQALPVELWVRGEPRGETILPALTTLDVPGLAEGRWRLRARWNGADVLVTRDGTRPLDLAGEVRERIDLPPGAIEGQDRDTLERAGRPVPSHAR